MNIKNAGQYLNFLQKNIEELKKYVTSKENQYRISEVHNLHDAIKEVDATKERKYNAKINDLIYLINDLHDEDLKVSIALDLAKKDLELDYTEFGNKLPLDVAIKYNSKIKGKKDGYGNLTGLLDDLKNISNAKTTEEKGNARGVKFNVEGNEVNYTYLIERKSEVDFNKEVVKNLYKKMAEKTDRLSQLIDEAMTKDAIKYEPKYSIYDSLDEIVEKYMIGK